MVLGERKGWETSDSKYCGVETDFSEDIPSLLAFNIHSGGFDFVLAPLMNPSYRPSLVDESNSESHVLPFAGSDLFVSPTQWRSFVTGQISSWIDLDSEDETLRMDSETTLKQEIAYATHLSLRACVLPTPKGSSCANYARCVNQILQGLNEMELWLRIPLRKSYSEDPMQKDWWELWNSFRLLCDHDSKLCVALEVGSMLPSTNSIERWFGDSVKAAIIRTECFEPTAHGYPNMLRSHQELIEGFFHHSVQVIISRGPVHNLQEDSVNISEGEEDSVNISEGEEDSVNISEGEEDSVNIPKRTHTHPHKPYLIFVTDLFRNMLPLSDQERKEVCHRDRLRKPLQPLKYNLEAQNYEMLERDSVKYNQYQRAIAEVLMDMVPDEEASELTTVLMVVGAGRGPLVRASLQAAEETGRKLKVYAVEKNPNAVVTLHELVKTSGWEDIVTVISCDMRFWNAPERADILVSELLGSFGDNENSPECLDGAQRFLKPDGISIPFSHTSFIQPITTSKLYNELKASNDLSRFETAYAVKLHNVARLAPCQPLFTFTHPNFSRKPDNHRYRELRFYLPSDMGSALVHGIAGYFEAVLYGNVHICTEPTRRTPNMFGWFPMFFPLSKPVEVHPNTPIDVHFWRLSDSTKVWYEWSLSLPTVSPIHNTNGSSSSIGL